MAIVIIAIFRCKQVQANLLRMKAITFETIGSPLDLEIHDVPIPEIGDDDVVVKMVAASINPGDFMFIQALYPEAKRPVFPRQIAGNHGAGIVEKAGKNVTMKTGTLVAFSHYNTWAEYAAVPAERLIPLPVSFPIEKAGQFVNFISAWDLLEMSGVQPGQWLALTAGNSTVSVMAAQFARRKGVKVLAIVRKAQTHLDLKTLGADEVIELSKLEGNISDRIAKITQGKHLNGVIDSVGGALAGDLVRSLADGGRFVIYGGYSPEKFSIHNFDLLIKGAEIRTYIYRYFFDPPKSGDFPELEKIAEITEAAAFRIPIGGSHPLDDFKAAIYETAHRPELGKRFFNMVPTSHFPQSSPSSRRLGN